MLLGHDAMLGAVVAGPTADAYARASDKESLLLAASKAGIRIPRQRVVHSSDDPLKVSLEFETVVAKPAKSVIEIGGKTTRVGVRYCHGATALSAALRAYPAEAFPILVQERIHGDGVGVFLFRASGRTLLTFGHRRLREKPPAGGVSTYREAWVPPVTVVTQCESLLDALDYEGAAMLEFKEDGATKQLVLMEINARLWGSVQLAVDAGVDFPSALVAWSLNLPIDMPTSSQPSVRSVWELGELDHALAIMRKSANSLSLPPETPTGLAAAVRVLLDHRSSDQLEVFRVSDPMPFVAELGRWVLRR
jgi:predicted ATP-grasp superfamily ATP-dependent carboligase